LSDVFVNVFRTGVAMAGKWRNERTDE